MVCTQQMRFEIGDDHTKLLEGIGGCPGNLIRIPNPVTRKKIADVIAKFEGIS